MKKVHFSELVQRAWACARTAPPQIRELDARSRAGAIALECARVGTLPDPRAASAAVNLCALADAARERLVVHTLTRTTIDLIAATDLRDAPPEPPAILRGPWLLESARTDALLPEGLSAIGGYELDGRTWLVGYLWESDALLVGESVLRWGSTLGEVALSGNRLDDPTGGVIADVLLAPGSLVEWERALWEGLRTAITLGLLLEARGAPALTTTDSHPASRKGASRDERRAAEQWTTRTLDLRGGSARAASAPAEGGAASSAPEGRDALMRPVRGHLRRVAVGPGGKGREWAWIESHDARRWVSPLSRVRVRA